MKRRNRVKSALLVIFVVAAVASQIWIIAYLGILKYLAMVAIGLFVILTSHALAWVIENIHFEIEHDEGYIRLMVYRCTYRSLYSAQYQGYVIFRIGRRR
jgi:hypothetical protein